LSLVFDKNEISRKKWVKTICYSQISLRLIDVNTGDLAGLLGRLAKQYWLLQSNAKGLNANIGILLIIDSTYIKLPNNASNWTAISKESCGIKLYIRIVAASSDSIFPEKIILSSGNVADSDAINHIINADGDLNVMDRGYAHTSEYQKMN
jgi:hypothetical protein